RGVQRITRRGGRGGRRLGDGRRAVTAGATQTDADACTRQHRQCGGRGGDPAHGRTPARPQRSGGGRPCGGADGRIRVRGGRRVRVGGRRVGEGGPRERAGEPFGGVLPRDRGVLVPARGAGAADRAVGIGGTEGHGAEGLDEGRQPLGHIARHGV